MSSAKLFVVATPIGNLSDLSPRAQQVLGQVDCVAAEDTRHTGKLLQHFNIKANLISVHDHNERQRAGLIIDKLASGQSVALVSDAGTPLISDPGFVLVRAVREAGYDVSPVPGCCAFVAALSASGMPSDRFSFIGFLPSKQGARLKTLERLVDRAETLIFYESTHRIVDSLKDIQTVFGEERQIAVARELTKTFETIYSGSLRDTLLWIQADANQQRGEFVLIVEGFVGEERVLDGETLRILALLAQELPPKKAAALTSDITGVSKKELYQCLIS